MGGLVAEVAEAGMVPSRGSPGLRCRDLSFSLG